MPAARLCQAVPDLFFEEVLKRLDPTDRTGGAALAGGHTGLGPSALAEVKDGAAQAQRVLHVERAAGLGEGERVPVGRAGMQRVGPHQPLRTRRLWRAPGGSAVGAGARLPVERVDELLGSCGRAPGGAAVGAGTRLPVGVVKRLCVRRWGGHLEVMQWAREHDCPWGVKTCCCAARGGHLEVLQWAREHGCPWDRSECAEKSRDHPETWAWVLQQPE